MNYDYLRSPTRMQFDKPEMYVAFRCLRLIRGKLATIKYTLAEYGMSTVNDSPEYIFAEFAAGWRSYTREEITVDNFPEHAKQMRSYYGERFPQMANAYLRIIGEEPSIWSRLQSGIVKEHWSAIESALDFAISRVDCSRSEREIVRYINLATRTEYFRSQVEGLRRVRRNGRKAYVTPQYFGAVYAIFGTAFERLDKLRPRQRQLIDRIIAIVDEDLRNGRVDDYSVDLNGGYRIKNRYIASRLGVHEASLSRSLGAIRSVKH